MSAALLDPWVVETTVDPSSGPGPLQSLQEFFQFCKTWNLSCVRFVVPEIEAKLFQQPKHGSWTATIYRWLQHLVLRDNPGQEEAQVLGGPDDLPSVWKRVLRQAVGDGSDWRTPTIVVEGARPWPKGHDITIQGGNVSHVRHLLRLKSLDQHPTFAGDMDPWDYRSATGSSSQRCRLPCPPELARLKVHELTEAVLAESRRLGRMRGKVWYFVPPDGWEPRTVPQSKWRNGQAFAHGKASGHTGPLDADGIVWEWGGTGPHIDNPHWDVQIAIGKDKFDHKRVSPEGLLFDEV